MARTTPRMLAFLALSAGLSAGCGARSSLLDPPEDYVAPGAPPEYCGGAEATSIYVITIEGNLFRFFPDKATFESIGSVQCPVQSSGTTPFSMAVDYQGTAYVVFDDGELFLVSGVDASCTPAPQPVQSSGFTPEFGMGFSANSDGKGEMLYLASTDTPGVLGTLDTTTFAIHAIAPFSKDVGEAELTGTGDGHLFAFGVVEGSAAGSNLARIDKTDGSVESEIVVNTPPNPNDWAFGFWGGDFYFFTGVNPGSTTVGRYRPADGSFDATYASLDSEGVVGAGVSTCAPR